MLECSSVARLLWPRLGINLLDQYIHLLQHNGSSKFLFSYYARCVDRKYICMSSILDIEYQGFTSHFLQASSRQGYYQTGNALRANNNGNNKTICLQKSVLF